MTEEEPIVGARVSMGSAVHIAYIMGCDPIVLLGNDCCLKDGKRYFWQHLPKEQQPHRVKSYKFSKRTQNIGFNQKMIHSYWNDFAKYNKEHGVLGERVEIIDCSESSLSCFPKMTLQEILNKYGDRRK